jgi:hypothetical protein
VTSNGPSPFFEHIACICSFIHPHLNHFNEMKHILDGVYKVEYFSKSTKKKEARIIQVRNHSWTSEDGKFKNDVHVDESKGTTHVFLQNGSKQWTSWSGELPPNKLCWASNNASIGTVTWTLQGDREKVSKTTIFSTSILDAAVRCIAFCLMCSSVYHTLEIPIMFSSDVGFLSGLISSAPDFSMYKIDTISGYAVAVRNSCSAFTLTSLK